MNLSKHAAAPLSPKLGDGREKRSEDTRKALIKAGLELFGDYGVQGTTTRMLSAAAETNIAAIAYHFGSKEGLYLAVVTHIAERIERQFSSALPQAREALRSESLGPDQATRLLLSIIDHMTRLMIESDEVRVWARILVREQSKPTAAFDILYKGRMEKNQTILARFVSIITGLDAEATETKIRVHALIGQIHGFATRRESLLRAMGVPKFTQAHQTMIRRILQQHVEACLSVPPLSSSPDVPHERL